MHKLLIVTGFLSLGGLERITCFIANKFIEKDWDVSIITLLANKNEKIFQPLNKSVKVIPFPHEYNPSKHRFLSLFCWIKLIRKIIKIEKPTSILCMTFKIGSLVALSSRKSAKKITVREISDPKSKTRNRFVNLLTEFFCRNIKNVIFQTNWERQCFHKRIKNKGVVIPNPISISLIDRPKDIENKFFTLSRFLILQKRQDILVEAFSIFHQKHPEYILEMFGDGPDKNKILNSIQKYKAENYIKICTSIPNVHRSIINYKCFVMTSDYEGMSNSLLESYLLGIPCISSDWPGVEDVITNGFDGLIYKRQDVNELVECFEKISTDSKLCNILSNNAIKRRHEFAQDFILEKYCNIIET